MKNPPNIAIGKIITFDILTPILCKIPNSKNQNKNMIKNITTLRMTFPF